MILESLTNDLILLASNTLRLLPVIAIGFLILILFVWISHRAARWITRPVDRYLHSSQLVRTVIVRTVQMLVILLGVYIFLSLAGLTHFAVAILSSTGVAGIILGFAFRDIAENFIASLLLSVQKPFNIGDVIELEGHKGVVQKVTARATTLIDFDGNHIQIPNATIYKNVIKNLTANPRMRGCFKIGIGYESGIRKAQSLAMNLMSAHEAILDDPEPQVLISELGASTVNLVIYFWVDSETHSVLKVASMLMRLVLREFERNGISLPDDARELLFPRGIPVFVHQQENDFLPEPAGALPSSPDGPEPAATRPEQLFQADTTGNDDLESDAADIRDQAASSRAPEQGENII